MCATVCVLPAPLALCLSPSVSLCLCASCPRACRVRAVARPARHPRAGASSSRGPEGRDHDHAHSHSHERGREAERRRGQRQRQRRQERRRREQRRQQQRRLQRRQMRRRRGVGAEGSGCGCDCCWTTTRRSEKKKTRSESGRDDAKKRSSCACWSCGDDLGGGVSATGCDCGCGCGCSRCCYRCCCSCAMNCACGCGCDFVCARMMVRASPRLAPSPLDDGCCGETTWRRRLERGRGQRRRIRPDAAEDTTRRRSEVQRCADDRLVLLLALDCTLHSRRLLHTLGAAASLRSTPGSAAADPPHSRLCCWLSQLPPTACTQWRDTGSSP